VTDEPVPIPIEDALDLHAFAPRDIPSVVSEYLQAARARGWQAAGLNFPGHFLIRIENRSGRAIVDPYAGGRVLGIEDLRALLKSVAGLDAELQAAHYAAVDHRAILIRLLNNLRLRAQETQDPRRALAAAGPAEGALDERGWQRGRGPVRQRLTEPREERVVERLGVHATQPQRAAVEEQAHDVRLAAGPEALCERDARDAVELRRLHAPADGRLEHAGRGLRAPARRMAAAAAGADGDQRAVSHRVRARATKIFATPAGIVA
jgi:hypothetical protein